MEEPKQPLPDGIVERLVAAHDNYQHTVSEFYDDVLHEVADRVTAAGSVGKADIGALVLWKRISASTKWAGHLMSMSDQKVRETTAPAVAAVTDTTRSIPESARIGRSKLSPLPGFGTGDALASAVLLVSAPNRMAVYDRRAQAGLEALGLSLTPKPGRYGRYMALVERLTDAAESAGHAWQPRTVDLALYSLGASGARPQQ